MAAERPEIREPRRHEWERYRALLAGADLPLDGVEPGADGAFVVAVDGDGSVVGGAGVEGVGPVVMLRSLVVAGGQRGTGLGRALLKAMEDRACQADACEVYLLTTTAAGFFESHGYRRAGRAEAPEQIRQSREFAVLCPSSAVLMAKTLPGDG